MSLGILVLTSMPPYAARFLASHQALAARLGAHFLLCTDGARAAQAFLASGLPMPDTWMRVRTGGVPEAFLQRLVYATPGDYLLRLDDDEEASPDLEAWLASRAYEAADAWAFPQAHLWGDEDHVITNGSLWPCLQGRLGKRARWTPIGDHIAAERTEAPAAIEHHKFLVQDRQRREAGRERLRLVPRRFVRPERPVEIDLPEMIAFPAVITRAEGRRRAREERGRGRER